ncbi:MAG: ATPase domain-containing protein [Tepidisphaeraceae bacterium]|jgi:KaiC/GvpD/RAD55 family RecA-like ATPase
MVPCQTGFATLDEMLGGGIPWGNIALLRGGPGSGKTTIALQMIAHFLAENSNSVAYYFSLELDPTSTIDHAKDFEPCRMLPKLVKDKTLWCISNEELFSAWTERRQKAPLSKLDTEWMEKLFYEHLKDTTPNATPAAREARKRIIVVDSLNVMADLLVTFGMKPEEKIDLRSAMRSLSSAFRAWSKENSITLFLGEYHPAASPIRKIETESFFCDVEILLTPEAVAGHLNSALDCINPLGYVMERRLPKLGGDNQADGEPQAIEVRSFCRVLKSRNTRSQSRRCTYDIVQREGVKFYPTYPGDGAVLLFGETEPQNHFWDEFVFNEVPYSYPALRYERFGRKALQRIFATQRHWRYIPDRTDMYIGSFDSYWIKWYTELYERALVNDLTNRELEPLAKHLTGSACAELLRTISKVVCETCDLSSIPQPEDAPVQFDSDGIAACTAVFAKRAAACLRAAQEQNFAAGDARKFLVKQLDQQASSIFLRPKNFVSPEDEPNIPFYALLTDMCTEIAKPSWRGLSREGIDQAARGIVEGSLARIFTAKDYNGRVTRMLAAGRSKMCEDRDKSGILCPIPKDRLRLYGERQSPVLKSIERPPHRAFTKEMYGSVPYNANVSFLVYRNELLKDKKSGEDCPKANLKKLEELYNFERRALKGFQNKHIKNSAAWITLPDPRSMFALLNAKRKPLTEKQIGSPPFRTWEELIVWAEEAKFSFLIETQTFDTFICAFLELFWGFGGEFSIDENYEVQNEDATKQQMFQAFFLLNEMFRRGVIPRESTLDSERFGRHYSDAKPKSNRGDWCFARHWYSTFIDVLTAREKNVDGSGVWRWRPKDTTELGIMPIPVALQRFANIPTGLLDKDGFPIHRSCWGDWHLGVLRSTENLDLAIEILNSLMSSQKICEAAFCCAILPTVEDFYKTYGSAKCFNLPERADSIKLPDTTFRTLHDEYMETAKGRSDSMYDYRHCVREVHSLLMRIQNDPSLSLESLGKAVEEMFNRIGQLRHQTILLH